MFLGQHELPLNNERQVAIPAAFHEMLAGGAYITRGFEQNLLIMNEKVFQEIYKRVVSLNLADPRARLLLRLILGNASRLEMDAAGHAVIPENLRSVTGLEKDITLVGMGDYIEVWSPANWNQQSAALLDIAANSARFAELDLALWQA
jgi:MraZ protein